MVRAQYWKVPPLVSVVFVDLCWGLIGFEMLVVLDFVAVEHHFFGLLEVGRSV